MIYFIQVGGDGPIKIGVAVDPVQRLQALQVGHPEQLRIIATIPGGLSREAEIHRKLSAYRKAGEWFHPDQALFEHLTELRSPPFEVSGARAFAILYRTSPSAPTDYCPFCGDRHTHGEGDGHRVAHCVNGQQVILTAAGQELRQVDGYLVRTTTTAHTG